VIRADIAEHGLVSEFRHCISTGADLVKINDKKH